MKWRAVASLGVAIVGVASLGAVLGAPTNVGAQPADVAGSPVPFGNAGSLGSTPGQTAAPIVGMAVTPSGNGYWQVGADGGIFTFGDAAFFGSMGAQRLDEPIVGMASTPDGQGYWEVASDGGIFTFGDAAFYGSMGGKHLNQPMVGMATMRTGFPTAVP